MFIVFLAILAVVIFAAVLISGPRRLGFHERDVRREMSKTRKADEAGRIPEQRKRA